MDGIVLSIVIPIYNGADTVKRCLDSIWRQGLPEKDFEVICVDDCSTDNTRDVLFDIQKEHPQLRIFLNKENLRAGGARNHGVREAKGEYIVFIDADDLFYNGILQFSCTSLRGGALDVLMLDFSRQHSLSEAPKTVLNFISTQVLSGCDFVKINSCPFGPCKFVFRKELMVDNDVWFCERCCCEDVDWCLKLVLKAKTIQYLPKIISHVIINEQSQTAVEHKSLRTVADKFYAGFRLMELLDDNVVKNDHELFNYVKSVADLYYRQGVKYMTACYSSSSDKVKIIREYLTNYTSPSRLVKFAQNNPYLFSFATNYSSCVVPFLICIKRNLFKR